MTRSSEQYVVVGFGWVGQANALALSHLGFHVSYYDIGEPSLHYDGKYTKRYKHIPRLSALPLSDPSVVYLVCVKDNVPEGKTQDIRLIKNALAPLKRARGTVVLRSTIVPSLLRTLHFDYYVPEFLHEKYAVSECERPELLVIGKAKKTRRREPACLRRWEQRAIEVFRGTPGEASYIKYLSNLWNALRIAFVNEFGDAMRRTTGESSESVTRVLGALFHGADYLNYGKPFGGHCLPKDARAFTAANKKVPMYLLLGMYQANKRHHAFARTLPEWFASTLIAEKKRRRSSIRHK